MKYPWLLAILLSLYVHTTQTAATDDEYIAHDGSAGIQSMLEKWTAEAEQGIV
jgi:hypothetical protein